MEEISLSKKKRAGKWIITQLKKRLPIIDWLPNYKWRENLSSDIFGGVTIAFVNVPQALAFSVLANVNHQYGLYTACFSSLLYTIFGTAPISSHGPVAVGSMLTGEAVSNMDNSDYKTEEIAVTITFLIGLWYLIGWLFKLGVIVMIFRKPFVSGFITACSLHIVSKSVKMVLGIQIPNKYGYFSFFLNLHNLYDNFHLVNYPTVIISAVVIFTLTINHLVFRPLLAKYTKFIIPVEALVMIIAIVLSYFLNFESYGVPVVGDVPTGLPTPEIPNVNIISYVWAASIVVALVNFATSISMSLFFNDNVDPDQELFAMSVVNLVCCNLQCITIGNSMMRTVVSVNIGVKTLLVTVISSVLLFFVILFAGPLFYPLPDCVLGGIILTSAGQLFLQRMKEVKSIWSSSLENGFIWSASFAAGWILDMQMGLVVGGLLSLRQILSEMKEKEMKEKERLEEKELSEQETEGKDGAKGKLYEKLTLLRKDDKYGDKNV